MDVVKEYITLMAPTISKDGITLMEPALSNAALSYVNGTNPLKHQSTESSMPTDYVILKIVVESRHTDTVISPQNVTESTIPTERKGTDYLHILIHYVMKLK